MNKEPRELKIDLPDIELAGLEWGEPGQPVLLALHGWMDNAASFEPLALHMRGYRLIALELAGHGRSGHRPSAANYELAGYVADILSAMDVLGLVGVNLVGHSLGAGIASLIAASFPERVEKLVLLEGLGPLSGSPAEGPERFRKSIRRMGRSWAHSTTVYPDAEAAARRRARRGGISERAAYPLVRRGTEVGPDGLRWCSDLRTAEPSPFYLTEPQVLAFLEHITAPSLLIKGETGLLAQRATTERRERAIRGLEVAALPGGHYLHMDAPDEIAKITRRFLA